MKCKYGRVERGEKGVLYFDSSTHKFELFSCNEDAVKDSYCIFHHPTYWQDNKEEIRNKFMEKVDSAIENGEELFCVGYNLPRIIISEIKFVSPVHFENAIFHDLTIFSETEFTEASFFRAEFTVANFNFSVFANAIFSEAKFSGAYFYAAKFYQASFNSSELSEAIFDGAKFYQASFNRAEFYEASFNRAKFLGKTNFNYCNFLNKVFFEKSDFTPGLLARRLDPYNSISFKRTFFGRPEVAIFDGCDMERVSFIHTDISRVKFRNVELDDFRIYDEQLFLLRESEEERIKFIRREIVKLSIILNENLKKDIEKELELRMPLELYQIRSLMGETKNEDDEKKLEELERKVEDERERIKDEINEIVEGVDKKEKSNSIFQSVRADRDLTLDNILSVYRGFRENYDYHLKYEESGKFFVREMRLKKSFSNVFKKIIMQSYEFLNLYGESYGRPISLIALVILFFSLLRILDSDSHLHEVKLSIMIFFQLYGDMDALTLAERLIAVPILGSLYISLRRAFERRVRY